MSKDKKLNNLLGLEEFTSPDFYNKKSKTTKRTDVAKDVLESAEYTGKNVFTEKPKTKDEIKLKTLNNLISLDEYTEKEVIKDVKTTKRTGVAKDVIQEKKKVKPEPKEEKKEETKKKGLTASQKKLPEALQKSILKRQK